MTIDTPIPPLPDYAAPAGVQSDGRSMMSIADERFYTALGVMSAAAIERAFDGEHGDEREGPDDYHRQADTR